METLNLDTVKAHGQQAVWRMLDSSLCKMRYDLGTDQAPWSVAHFSGVSFGGVDIYDDRGIGGRKVLRSQADIDANPADNFLLAMPLTARVSLAQNGRVNDCASGKAILFSTSKPFSSAIVAERAGGQYAQLLARVSGVMLRNCLPHVDLLSNFVFSTADGAGKVVKSLFELGISEGSLFSSEQSRRYGEMLVEAIANVMCGAAVAGMPLQVEEASSRARVRRMALAFMDQSLSNPALDMALVAAHCGVSARYLHLAFAEVALKPGAYLRDARLTRCRTALLEPALAGCTLTEIALKWGYEDPAHFSRAYKARFGISPSEDRLGADASAPHPD